MHESGASLDGLSRAECLTLLATAQLGRVVYTEHALPAIRLVNFALDGDTVVFRTGPGGKLAATVGNSVVAFEVDNVDVETHAGWTVTVIGHSREVTEHAELRRLRMLPMQAWAPGPLDHLVCIMIELVSGRRLDHVLPGREPV